LIRTIRRVRPDIIHVSTPKAAFLGAMSGWVTRVPVRIFLMRGSATEGAGGLRGAFYRRLEWLTARLCNCIIAVSPSLLQYAHVQGIVPEGRGLVVRNGMSNGVDVERFDPAAIVAVDLATTGVAGPAAPDHWIGFVGRLARDKGIEELARAWCSLRSRFPDWGLILVGEWEERDGVSRSTRNALGDDPRVVIPGHVGDVAPWIARMDLFAFPSHGTEGFPNAPMEAAAMALPVVATTVVGSVDAVEHGVTGTLVPPRDSDALAWALARYMADPVLRASHGQAGRRRVHDRFRREPIWQGLDELYRDRVESRTAGTRRTPWRQS
jgi:glycosyltransferase involved in cell wall biosynthesis